MNPWKKLTWACDNLKLVICQRITSKNIRPRWVHTWARGTVSWYWSADALFWQLSIDHNIDVQLGFSWAPKLAKSVRVNIGFPVVRTDGRWSAVGGRCTVTWLPNFLGWVDLLCYGAPPTRALACAWSSANMLFIIIISSFFDPQIIYWRVGFH